jgi:proteasome accessory factor B
MSDDARSGLRKIRALGDLVDEPIIGFSPRLSLRDPAFPALQQAIESSRVVTFPYLKPGEDAPRTRRIQPLALIEYEGRWHVFGIDLDVGADRTFLLQRVVGTVSLTRASFDPALREGAGDRALAGLDEVAARNSALLEVNPGTEAALRLARRAQPAEQGIRVPYVDAHIFADELASYGPEVRVVAPVELRDRVIDRLAATRAQHEAAV